MQYRWLNDKQPDENGDITAVVENQDGTPVSVFKGKDIDEVAEKLLVGQTQANREISRLFKKLRPDQGRKPLKAQPTRVLTADDKFRLASEMNDPEKVVGAVQEIVNSTAKIPLTEIADKTLENDQRQSDEFYASEANAFREEFPEYNPTNKNRDALFDELKANGWDLTRNNLAIAYNTLMERGDLEPWPMEGAMPPTEGNREGGNSAPAVAAPVIPNGRLETDEPPEPTPSPRPRSIATGLRNSDASALPPPPPRKKQYTRADIERMPRAEYMQRLTDPEFRRQVDAMGS